VYEALVLDRPRVAAGTRPLVSMVKRVPMEGGEEKKKRRGDGGFPFAKTRSSFW